MRALRLDPAVRPRDVDVSLEIEPGGDGGFRGEVGIDLELPARRSKLTLHAAGLRVGGARLHSAAGVRRGRVEARRETETIDVRLDAPAPAGPARLELTFRGRLRRDLRGLYGARAGGADFVFSQLAPASARHVFPCFDEPAMKARFQLSVTAPDGCGALSNSPVERREARDDGRQTVVFERTPPLSSYLLALAVGPLECSAASFAGATEIRVWHAPGRAGLAEFALEAARECLLRLERWFDLPYPYAKLDLVAVPDFAFGAMENPGAIFFRETLLLVDPELATLAERKRAAEVIAHELAHMWYGDLVTMAWWDDLWLNEAFATWMAYRIVDEWRPEWCMWQSFMHQRAAALDLDALTHTHPIYAAVRTPDDANASFDVITYEKGAAVIRMLERYLGAEVFCAGVRRYIREHRESNAVASDLWRALSEVSGEDLEPVMRAWIEQAGHPLVHVRRVEEDGEARLELRQERFRLHEPRARTRSRRRERPARWPVPWVGRVGDGRAGAAHAVRHLLTGARARIPAEGADLTFVYGNADEGCFLRVAHDPDDLVDLVEDVFSLSPLERMGFVDHQWALVRAGRAPVASFMDLAARLGEDTDPDVLTAVRGPLALMARRIAPDTAPEVEERLRAWIEVYFGGQIDALGWQAAAGEDERTRQRRAALFDLVGTVGRASALLKEASRRCTGYLAERGSLDSDLADAVVAMAALRGDGDLHDAFRAARRTARTPQEQRRFLLALADFHDPEQVDRTLDLCLGDEVATQDLALLLVRLLENRDARDATWRFLRRRWSRLYRRMGPLMAARVVAATPALGTRGHRREVAAFFKEHPIPGGTRGLRQALERFDWYEAYRRRAAPELAAYLGGVPDA